MPLILILILVSILSLGLAPPPFGASLGDPANPRRFAKYLFAEIPPLHPIRVLDVGTGLGTFLTKIKITLEYMGYDTIVEGLDDYSMVRIKEKTGLKMAEEVEQDTTFKIWYIDIKRAHMMIRVKYDIIFINAPYPYFRKSDEELIEGSIKLLKEDGLLFVRFHEKEAQSVRLRWIRDYCHAHNLLMIIRDTTGLLPNGYFELAESRTLIIKKKPWECSDIEAEGKSLGNFGDYLFSWYEMFGNIHRNGLQFGDYLHHEVSREEPRRVLEICCGLGSFLPKIKTFFEAAGYQVIVEGIDDFSFFNFQRIEEQDMLKIAEQISQCNIFMRTFKEAPSKIKWRYDFIFLNAPFYSDKIRNREIMQCALKLVKDTGMIFLRLDPYEINKPKIMWLFQLCRQEGFEILVKNTTGILPTGISLTDDRLTLVIKRTHFFGVGSSLGKTSNKILMIHKQTNIAA